MMPTISLRVFAVSLLSLLNVPLTAAAAAVETSLSPPPPQHVDHSGRLFTEQPQADSSPSLLLLAVQASIQPAALKSRKETSEKLPESSEGILEMPPKPLPQIMLPRNVASPEALTPPLGAAQVAPVRPLKMDVCRGYYDVMGNYDSAFNCSKDSFIYCCGMCHYRFCCPERSRQLDQDSCKNHNTAPLTAAVENSPFPPPQQVAHSGRLFTEHPQADSSPSLLLPMQANIQPAALQSRKKNPEKLPESSEEVLEMPPKPLPQVTFPKNVTSSEALAPPLGAAQVAPVRPRMMDVWMDGCRGYYDVMGHFDSAFNCSRETFIYCCGTCYYRFCCPERSSQLDQDNCKNYDSPDWAKPQTDSMIISEELGPDPDFDPLKQQSHNTGFVIGGVVVFMVAVAVGIKVVFNKVQQEAIQRDLNMPRALVDMLRHQSSPVQQDERNNSVALTVGDGTGTLGRAPKNLYAPGLPSKDNRLGNLQHNFIHSSGSSPKHTATIERTPRMNNAQLAAGGTLLSSKHNNTKSQPSFHHSLHNLAQLPPSYESATKPELNRYSSLKRLEKGLDEYSSGYCTTKRRPHTAQPALQSSQHHLHWGGDYTLSGRGTLPRHAARPWIPPPPSGMPASPTPNPYPLDPPEPQYNPNYDTLSKPPRKVKSSDQLLNMNDVPGNTGTLSRMSKNQQHQYYKAMAASNKNSNTQTLTRKTQDRREERQERLLMSPDHLEERMGVGGMGVVDPYAHTGGSGGGGGAGGGGGGAGGGGAGAGGMVPTLPRQQKAQSQQNVCATPSLDRHHMIKMNSHPTSGREQERNTAMTGHMSGGMGWSGEAPAQGVVMGTGTLGGHSARRMAFAAKRQNTIEQLHFIPGGGGGGSAGSGGGSQGIRTGSKNEVTV